MKKLFFDMDGTLVDSRERLYQLFQHLVSESDLTFEAYWQLKRNKTDHTTILSDKFKYSPTSIAEFQSEWLLLIETDEWLQYDKPFEDVTGFLKNLQLNNQLFLVTARQSEHKVLLQVEKFGWNNIFTNILVTNRKMEKDVLIKQFEPTSQDWMIGDTGYDVNTGKHLGMRTAAVLSGFLSKEVLETYAPDIIANSVLDLHFN